MTSRQTPPATPCRLVVNISTTILCFIAGACTDTPGQTHLQEITGSAQGQLLELDARLIGPLEPVMVAEGEFGAVVSAVTNEVDRIWVADAIAQSILSFTATGQHSGTLGGSGEGPGEFSGLIALAFGRDSLFALDQSLRRVTAWPDHGSGGPRTVSLQRPETLLPAYAVFVDPNAGILVPFIEPQLPAQGDDSRSMVVSRVTADPSGRIVMEQVLRLPDREWLVTSDPAYGIGVSPLPFGKHSVLSVRAEGVTALGWTGSRTLYFGRLTEPQQRPLELPVTPVPVTSGMMRALEQSYIDHVGSAAAELVFGRIREAARDGELPDSLPVFDHLWLDTNDRVWVRTLGPDAHLASTPGGLRYVKAGGTPPATDYLVVDPHETTVQRVRFTGDIKLAGVTNEMLWGIRTDSLGVESLVAFDRQQVGKE